MGYHQKNEAKLLDGGPVLFSRYVSDSHGQSGIFFSRTHLHKLDTCQLLA